jgi:hypothetical protein
MMKTVATLAALATFTLTSGLTSVAFADDVTTLVVTTPNPPVVVVTGASAAPAGPSATASTPTAAAPAPALMTNDWRDVSHINGRVVPVGEHDEYLLTHKHTNLAFDPLTLLIGWIDVEAQFAIADNVAISASFATLSTGGTTGVAGALTAPIFVRKVVSGPYLEPGVVAYSFTDGDGASTYVGPQMSFGWQWMFDSGFNIALASGVARIDGEVVPQGYFRTGYAF